MTTPTEIEAFPVPDTRGGERGTPAERGSKLYADIAALLADGLPDPPKPLVLTRDDGHALMYAGQVNLLFGDPESGKTFIALAAISEVAKANRRTVFLDIDHNGAESVVARLLAMGVPEAYLTDPSRFRYIEPEDRAALLDIVAFLKTWRPAVAVVDSVGELLPLLGRKSNDPDDFTSAHASVLKPLAQVGTCVVAIDHLAKNTESRASGPTGTAAKRRAIGGVSIRVAIKDQFVPEHGGSAWLTVNKDRHGGLRQHCPRGDREPSAGLFTMRSEADRITWNIKAPKDSDAADIAGVGASDLAALDALDPPPESVRDVKERLRWRSDRATEALRVWRSRSQSVPGEQGTDVRSVPQASGNTETVNLLDLDIPAGHDSIGTVLGSVPRSPTPVWGTGEHADNDGRACEHCGTPVTGHNVLCADCTRTLTDSTKETNQ